MQDPQQITLLLQRWQGGDRLALDRLYGLLYGELKKNAYHVLGLANGESTLSATDVASEAYLRLVNYPTGPERKPFVGRKQFFGLAQKAMLHIMLDYQKHKQAKRRGGDMARVRMELDDIGRLDQKTQPQVKELEQILGELALTKPDWYHIIHHRFTGETTQTVKQLATSLGASERDIYRKTNLGLAWIRRRFEMLEAS